MNTIVNIFKYLRSKQNKEANTAIIVLLILILAFVILKSTGVILRDNSNTVRILVLEGVISDSSIGAGITPRLVDRYLGDSVGYGAIVFRINSPGGSVVGSQEILDKIRRFKKSSGIPIVASIGETGASGAYYISLGADKIVAGPGSLTGGIGVISQFIYTEGLLNKLGIETEIIKSGKHKDLGVGPMTEEQRAVIQDISDDIYQQFISEVSSSRDMDIDEVEELATGEAFTGNQAYLLGLIDEVGSLDDAVSLARGLKDLKGEEEEIKYIGGESNIFDLLSNIKAYIYKLIEGSYNLRWQLTP